MTSLIEIVDTFGFINGVHLRNSGVKEFTLPIKRQAKFVADDIRFFIILFVREN